MKKVFFVFLGFLIAFSFSACLGQKPLEILYLNFYVDDGSAPPQYYSESSLNITPNYEARSLAVDFSKTFPKRTDEGEKDEGNVVSEGLVGGEYFDRFEQVVEIVLDYQQTDLFDEVESSESGVFQVISKDVNGELYNVDTFWIDDSSEVEILKSFFLDMRDLLIEEVKI